jgi:hypothetical protein
MLGLTLLATSFIFASVILGMFISYNIHGQIGLMVVPYMALFFTFFLVTYTGTIPPVASLAIATVAFIIYGRVTRRGVSLPGGDGPTGVHNSWAS